MRIGVITTSFPRFDDDIAGAFVLGCVRALVRRGHTVEVIAPEPAERLHPPVFGDGIDVVWAPYLRPRTLERTFYGAGVPDNLRHDARAWLGLAPASASLAWHAERRIARWDAVMSHWATPCALIAGLIRRRRPHLAVLHSADLHALATLPSAVSCAVARSASGLWFVSDHHRRAFLTRLPAGLRTSVEARSRVGPMGIDPPPGARPARAAARAALGVEGFTLLALGRLVTIKGLDHALHAMRGLAGVELLVAGDGPERARLTALASRHRSRVHFLGSVTGERKETALAAADALVVPSRTTASGRTEGVPTAAIEALVRGVPVIASATGGLPELLAAGGGLIVEPRADSLRNAITRLHEDRALHAKLVGEASAVGEGLTWSRVAPRLESALRGAALRDACR